MDLNLFVNSRKLKSTSPSEKKWVEQETTINLWSKKGCLDKVSLTC